MADIKISAMTAAATLTGAEVFEVVQGGATFKATVTAVSTFVLANIPAVTFAAVTAKPTTLSGYGITDAAPLAHVGAGGAAHAAVTTTVNGFMIAADKVKLDGVAASANNYVLPVAGAAIGGVKKAAAVAAIPTPASATAQDIATAFNLLLTSLQAAGSLT